MTRVLLTMNEIALHVYHLHDVICPLLASAAQLVPTNPSRFRAPCVALYMRHNLQSFNYNEVRQCLPSRKLIAKDAVLL